MNTAAKGWDDDSDDGIPRKAKQLRVCTKQLCRHEATNTPPIKVRPTPRSCKAMVGAMSKKLTPKEKRAIQGLKRIASKWPLTLCLVHHGDSFGLDVKRADELGNDPAEATSLANILIKTESCA